MTQREYDALYNQLQALTVQVQHVVEWLGQLSARLTELEAKTLVISDVDKDIASLKVDVQALKDEQEA